MAAVAARAILFDLFGTLVRFSVRTPILRAAGTEWRSTMPWLADTFRRELPEADFDSFVQAIAAVTAELVRARPPGYLEVPSRVRFLNALSRIGVASDALATHAETLSLAHMAHLASSVELPDGHVELLAALAPRFRIALVSNFDHGATARGLLDRFGLTPFLETILISEEFGRRKPHPAIFHEATERLGVSVDEAVYVGDSPGDDIVGGHAAGMRVIWVNPSERALPAGVPAPHAVIRSLLELEELLG